MIKRFHTNERILREDYDHQNVEVINAGVAGHNSWESLINLQFRILDIHPDLIIVYHGTNDVHTRLVSPDAYTGDNSGRRIQWNPPSIPLVEHSLLLRIISRKLHLTNQVGLEVFVNAATYFGGGGKRWPMLEQQVIELLRKNPPIFFRRNLTNMVSIARANGVDTIFATWAHSPYFEDYASTKAYQLGFRENNEIVKEVASHFDVHLYDFASMMPKDKKYWADGRHLNEAGALLKANLFAKFIQDSGVLKKRDIIKENTKR